MRRLGQPMQFQALRRSVIDVYIKVVPQNVRDLLDRTHAVKFENVVADDGRAVRALAAPPEARVGLDVDRLLCDG